ncbi:MAG: response regulator [bacterium]|nr:response regulator [bacterium]
MAPDSKKPVRILLVDDETDLVEFLAQLLLKKGFTVTATNSGSEALEAIAAQTFDVAIVDLKMPEMDGIELLEKVHAAQPYLEAIMLTGHGSFGSALEAGRLKAFSFMLKPCQTEELMQKIREAHAHREWALEAAYRKELAEAMEPGHTSHDILAKGEELRRKYERD